MMQKHIKKFFLVIFGSIILSFCLSAEAYDNFDVAVYSRAYETRQMGDLSWLEPRWNELTRQVHVDKIYLETYRDAGKRYEALMAEWLTNVSGVTDKNGKFAFRGFHGDYEISLKAEIYTPSKETFSLISGDDPQIITLRMAKQTDAGSG